jgi:hypothetical protein
MLTLKENDASKGLAFRNETLCLLLPVVSVKEQMLRDGRVKGGLLESLVARYRIFLASSSKLLGVGSLKHQQP